MERKIETKNRRSATFEREAYDAASNTITLSFASELPVARWYGDEILSCDPADVDLSRMANGGPLLWGHENDDMPLGVVESVAVSGGVCRATCKMSKREDVAPVIQDIMDGIISKVSVGYEVTKELSNTVDADGKRTIRWAWRPYEISLVSVPADDSVGIGRAHGEQINKPENRTQEQVTMSETIAAPAAAPVVLNDTRKDAAEIIRLARKHDKMDMGEKAIADGMSLDAFRAAIIDELGKAAKPSAPAGQIGMSDKEVKRFSFLNVIRAMAGDRSVNIDFERECSDAVLRGKNGRGNIRVPWDVLVADKRDLQIAGGGTGSYFVATNTLTGSFIEALKARSVLPRLGCPYLTGLSGDIAIPKGGTATGYWVAETVAPTESTPTLAQVTGSPNTCGTFVDISRKLMIQSGVDTETFVRNEIAAAIAGAMDVAAFTGAGTAEPVGLDNATGCTDVSVTAGTPTFAEMLGFASAIEGYNAANGPMRWAMPSAVFYKLAATAVASNAPKFVADYETGRVLGLEAVVSNNVQAKYAYLGDWSQFVVGVWGNGLDILVDPYSSSTTGAVRITGFMDVDFMIRHGQAFARADVLS